MMPPPRRPPGSGMQSGFSLIELLVVISIIALLAGTLMGTIGMVQDSARSSKCMGNLRQVGMAYLAYAQDNEQCLPNDLDAWMGNYVRPSTTLMADYTPTTSPIWQCTVPKLIKKWSPSWQFVMNWRLKNSWVSTLGTGFGGHLAVPLAKVKRTTDAYICGDLDTASSGGYHRGYANLLMVDGHVLHRQDESLTVSYSLVITYADPARTSNGEYMMPGPQGIKGYGY